MAGQTVAGRYVLEQPLGGGAMGSVWRARDLELERDVAVQLLAPAADRARFAREARAVAGLAHPNVCQLYDYGEAEQGPYMILEYLPGGTLEDRLARARPLPDEETAGVAADVAGALAYAHAHGVVHRDLKPANILFDAEGRAKIADWGIARIAGGEALTKAGTVMGTAAYISPEQGAGEEATPASDVYSFGAILYRMLTGRPPFASDSALELVRLHREAAPAPVGELRPDAPSELAALAEQALAKEPARRPRDGAALVAALAGAAAAPTAADATAATLLLGGAAMSSPTQVIPAPGRARRRTAPLLAAALLALVAAGVAAAIVVTRTGSSSSPPTGPVSLPNVSAAGTSTAQPFSSSTAVPATTAATTAAATSSTESSTSTTTAHTTTTTTTAATSTAPATTAPPPPTISTTPSTSTDTTATSTVASTSTTTTP